MSKYYISSGNLNYVTTAEDANSVALWAVNQFVGERVDLGSLDLSNPQTIFCNDVIEAMLEMNESINVSEIGYGHDDAASFDTAEIIHEWGQLLVAVRRLESLLG